MSPLFKIFPIMKNTIWLLCIAGLLSGCHKSAQVKEVAQTMPTYPFSDPDPVINPDNAYYPYFQFEGYTHKPEDKKWKVVELENDYVKVSIFPEIGGKIWGAVEKSKDNDFIYYNHAVKFRHVAMRGPWTSGGIEPNFGIIGHAPTSATPIDYTFRTNEDGSVSCFIGALDLLTHSYWSVEINLPKDKGYFTTTTHWNNANPLNQPYYHWMNAGYKAGDDLDFYFPGQKYIGHPGDVQSWPVNGQGIELDKYANNNFGTYKSYHVMGDYNDYYGAYWNKQQAGSVHYSPYDEKLGMKVWIWGLSRQGMIWEDLLTDKDGQYVELQSGRMFNQPATNSMLTPFKHFGFEPYASDSWKEYWYPVNDTRGISKANQYGALNVVRENGYLKMYFCPMEQINEPLKVVANGQEIYNKIISAPTLATWKDSFQLNDPAASLKITLGNNLLVYSESSEDNHLSRPLNTPDNFDWNSIYGLYLKGQQWVNQKFYDRATRCFEQCLEKDPLYVPALNSMAELLYRKADYTKALELARQSMSINAYDPAANLVYGLTNAALGKSTDAKDGFSIAAYSPSFRSAAYTELAKAYAREQNWKQVGHYASKSIQNNTENMDAYQLLAIANRKLGNKAEAKDYIEKILYSFPLNHFMRFEAFKLSNSPADRNTFTSAIRNELPQETYLEMAGWYENINAYEEAAQLLELSPKNAIVAYRLAYILDKEGKDSRSILEEARQMSPALVSPFRKETLPALEWAAGIHKGWPESYYLGLNYWALGYKEKALGYFETCGDEVGYAPFYLTRAQLKQDEAQLADLKKAEQIEKSWRTGSRLINYYLSHNQNEEAYQCGTEYIHLFPQNYYLGLKYATSLLNKGMYKECVDYLKELQILPNEGATDGRTVYRDACLQMALEQIKAKNYDQALEAVEESKLWIENLGVGKPYDADLDERAESFIAAYCYRLKNEPEKAKEAYRKIISTAPAFSSNTLLTALALRESGQADKALALLNEYRKVSPSPIAEYCYYIYTGNRNKADEALAQHMPVNEAAPWEMSSKDSNISIVKAIEKTCR